MPWDRFFAVRKRPLIQQQTIKNTVTACGVGLHSGQQVTIRLLPAVADSGIVFRRIDVSPPVDIPARAHAVVETTLSTTISRQGYKIATVEHFLSAVAGIGIDNLLIEINGAELPIMDGSAAPFVFLLQTAGVVKQAAHKRFLRIIREVKVQDAKQDSWVRLYPYEGFRIAMTLDFRHPVFRQSLQHLEIDFARSSFVKEISRARTFGFLKDVEALRAKQLALGGSLANAVVLDDEKIVNPEGLRFENEFVKHKVLDVVGDLSLLGSSIIGAFEGYRSGHALNNRLLRSLLAQPSSFEWVSLQESPAPILSVA